MTDYQIREALHRKRLNRYHRHSKTLVIDELGLMHGKGRADIAVVNGRMYGFEIKSDVDSLDRLKTQIDNYNAVFDHIYLVVTERHLSNVMSMVPSWWGVIIVWEGPRGGIYFRNIRCSQQNHCVDNYSVAQLLWRDEARQILIELGIHGKLLREKRSILYQYLVDSLESHDLRTMVRNRLRKRQNWRLVEQPSLSDDWYPPNAKL